MSFKLAGAAVVASRTPVRDSGCKISWELNTKLLALKLAGFPCLSQYSISSANDNFFLFGQKIMVKVGLKLY